MIANRVRMVKKGGGGLPKGTVFDFDYTGDVQTLELPKGNYLLEVWGGAGGSTPSNNLKSKGGYSKGILTLKKNIKTFIYCGGEPVKSTSASNPGGFNGGGLKPLSSSYIGAAGGGGTDIRINEDSLYSRVIVAGGGAGGGGHTSADAGAVGDGGGLNGGNSPYATGGTQTTGGVSQGSYTGTKGVSGEFGKGGDGLGGSSYGNGGAGGGGWYGGASGHRGNSNWGKSGGGGSGYIHTPDSHKPEGWLLTEEHFLTEAETIAGNQTIPNPTGGTQIGHTGNGYARITVV